MYFRFHASIIADFCTGILFMPSCPAIETPVEQTAATKVPIALVGSGVFWAGVIAIIGVTLPHLALLVEDEKVLLLMNFVFFELAVQGRGRDCQLTGRGLAIATVLLQGLNYSFPFDFR